MTAIPQKESNLTAPTPQNTPLQTAPITLGLSRPTVPDISEDKEEDDNEDLMSPEAARNMAIQGLVSSKLAHLVGKSSGYVEALPAPVKRAVEGLKGVQQKCNDLQAQYKRECWELEKKVRVRSRFYVGDRAYRVI
jgi:nucleosome assembly protein 1-like 1